MHKTITAVVAATFVLSLATPPAGAHGALSETYTAVAPTPMQLQSKSEGSCLTAGVEGIHKNSHPFRWSVPGVLIAQIGAFQGDWDLGIVDQSGRILTYTAYGPRFPTETVKVSLAAEQSVSIVACNFTGGPTATVSFSFTPKQKQAVSVGDVVLYEGDEGTRAAVFTVSLVKASTTSITVDYATVDSSATASDYTARTGTLTFAPGVTSAGVKVPIRGDTEPEAAESGELRPRPADPRGGESFRLVLSNPTGTRLGDAIGVGTILDDEGSPNVDVPRLAVSDLSIAEGDGGTRNAVFTVSLSKRAASTVTVSYSTSSDNASAGQDYEPKAGTLTFSPGIITLPVKVAVFGDTAAEPDEVLNLELSASTGATIVGSGLARIIDDL